MGEITRKELDQVLINELDNFSTKNHPHTVSQITDLSSTIANKTVGNATGNIPISNGTTNSNLNADMLDGKHASDFSLSTHTHTDKLSTSLKGQPGGLAELDDTGKVPANQLPSFVDDVVEGKFSTFPATGESGKIYVDTDTNITYRWGGTGYVIISDTIALGETSSTAYRGDRGKAAYDHSITAHAPSTAQKNSDITKAEIEAKLTGEITTHTHGLGQITGIASGVCSTAAATAAKVLTVTGFTLTTGCFVVVKFANTNTATSPTLNVNGTGAKPIWFNGSAIPKDLIIADDVMLMFYDGTNWCVSGALDYATETTALTSGGTGSAGSSSRVARADHTHTLPAYPTALPASGGNADTVDGKHASDFLSSTGGTITGPLTVDHTSPLAFNAKRGSYVALMGCSTTAGEYLFGGGLLSANNYTDYIRIGVDKLLYRTGGNDYNIFHQGNKPTSDDISDATSDNIANKIVKRDSTGGASFNTISVASSATIPTIYSATMFRILNGGSAQNILTGGVLASSNYADSSKIPTNGIYSKGNILTNGNISMENAAPELTVKNTSGSDVAMVFDRSSNANFKMLNTGGIFKFQCDYLTDTGKGSYYDVFSLYHTSGNAVFKGAVYGTEFGQDGTMTIVPQSGSEVNFGGTTNAGTIYFGKTAVGRQSIPGTFVFGGSTGSSLLKASRFQSTVATGTSPFVVASTTAVSNLNSDLLDGLHASSFLRADASNNNTLDFAGTSGLGIRFYSSSSYSIYMSPSTDETNGGRVTGETTSDYNMYFRMGSGVNRGFVFKNAAESITGIDAGGNIRTKGSVTVGNNKVEMKYNETTESLDFVFV